MKALIIVDVQNDFCPGGSLAVPRGDEVIKPINSLSPLFPCVVQTQDWHPANHSSFASNHEGKEPYETVQAEYGEQVLWPDHCIQSSKGSSFQQDLNVNNSHLIIRKGFRPSIDSYSAFFENDHSTPTGLDGYLKEREVDEVYICGLATDFCVKWSALDALKQGYTTFLIEDAVKGIDLDGSVDAALAEMKEAGVQMITSKALLRELG